MSAVKWLAIISVTIAVTLLCIRSGQAMVKSTAAVIADVTSVYQKTDGQNSAAVQGRGKLLMVTDATPMTSDDLQDLSSSAERPALKKNHAVEDGKLPLGNRKAESGKLPPGNRKAESGKLPLGNHTAEDGKLPLGNRTAEGGKLPLGNRTVEGGKLPIGNHTAEGGKLPLGNRTAEGGKLPLGNRTAESDMHVSGRSLNTAAEAVRADNYFLRRPMTSRIRAPPLPIVVRGKFKRQQNPANRQSDSIDDDDDDDDDDDGNHDANIIVDAGVFHTNNRYGQMDLNGYSTINTDISVAEEDGSTGYHNSYGMNYNTGGYYKPGGNPNGGTGWIPMSRPEHPSEPHSSGGAAGNAGGMMGKPHYGYAAPYPINPMSLMGYKQMPMMPPYMDMSNHYQPPIGQVEQYNIVNPLQQIQMVFEKIDWHKVGILALFKFGLAKLKAFGFLKLLFLLVFKLKLFLIAMFFKFLLILKLMKVFKILMVPLILLTVLPMLGSALSSPMLVGGILSFPQRIIDFLTGPVYAPAATAVTKYSDSDPTILPSGSSSASTAKIGGVSTTVRSKLGDLNLFDRRRLELLDPTLTVLRKVLDSEKCVERIACRMAVVENAGILPVWINWVLHRVSKLIHNKKLESYLKTYDEVNNDISMKTDAPDNWATWCLERYDCNSTNLTDTKQ